MTVAGLILLWKSGKKKDVPWSGQIFVGSLIMGWGIFNLVEGIIDHHILGIHHVIERLGLSVYDYAFLASGVIFGNASNLCYCAISSIVCYFKGNRDGVDRSNVCFM
jgi:uncharacterized membrane protein